MATVEEMSDRVDIQDLIARYSRAIDTRAWADLDLLFSPDAWIDYTAMGGIEGDLGAVKSYLAETFATFGPTQHMMGLPVIELDGDRAGAVTPCHNPMVIGEGDDPLLLFCGLVYHEQFVRTPHGWRIENLREERCYMRFFRAKH